MKILLAMFATMIFSAAVHAQAEPVRYEYHIWGKITDSRTFTRPGVTVCLIPAVRPIHGRIPCATTDYNGNYALTVSDIPDKYTVLATTSKQIFMDSAKDETASSEVLTFGAADECKHISLQIKPKKS